MMAEFLQSQLDYILFFYGLAFLLLVPICLFLNRRSYRNLPWIWLVWFGVLHGIYEWLDLFTLSLGSGPAFDYIRLGVLILSFVCLAEFGRAGTYTLWGRGPGRWILVVMTALVGIGGLAGYPGLLAATRYVLGLAGGMWAAGALLLLARTEVQRSWTLQAGALAMAGYALATGLVVPPAPFFPAAWLNYDSFAAATIVPVQLIRGCLATVISVSLCLFAETCLEKEPQFRVWFRRMLLVAMTVLVLLLTMGWGFTQYLGNIAKQDKWEDYEQDAENLSQSLTNKMGEADRLVKLMSGFPAIFSALANGPPRALQQANAFLHICSQTLPETACYLIDHQGLTIASSNRDIPDRFLGQSSAFRPYSQEARQGSAGRYWALGVTSKDLGYYASVPVRDQAGQVFGAAVIKRTFSTIQTAIIHYRDLGLIINRHGIVIMASNPGMILRSLWPLSAATREALLASRQFGNGPFAPILDRKPADKSELLVEGKRVMVRMRPISGEDCAVVIFGSIRPVAQARLLGISTTLLFFLGSIGFLAILLVMRQSEEGFHQIFEHATDNLILHDRGRIIEVNQQSCRSLGYTREELLRMSVFDIEVGYSKDFLIDLWEKGGGVVTLSGIYRRKDGLTFPAEIRAGEIFYRGQTMRLVAARDVSARMQAEEALRESEEYYRSLFSNMLNGYAYCQMCFEQEQPVDFIFLNVNKAFGDLTGLMEVIGKKVSEVIPGIREADPDFLEMCGRVAATGIPERAECYLGSLKMWFSISVYSPLKEYFVAIFDVITERKQAEEALRDREAKYRAVVETSADGFCIKDMAGRFLEFNDAFASLLGYSREELLGMSVPDIEAQMTPAEVTEITEKVRREGHAVFETKNRSKDGRVWPAEVNVSYWPIAGGRLFVFMRDITDRKRAEEALRASEAALRQSQERYRMLAGHLLTAQEAERKKLARELHDDLSQRLAALAMEAETLDYQKSPKTGLDRVRLKEMKDKLVELSIDVHAMSRRLHPSILDDLGLADAVASECATFRKRNGIVVNYRTENISREVPPNVAVCLYRIVQEALRNISRHARATEVAISLEGVNQAIRLLIRDNGKGFDQGQKTNKVGLGLDSMKERAYLIGADFSLESQPGQGTMIEVRAPLSRRPE
jgi:PAS domain S-box-containing protein